jgi:hypothetical protein
MCHRHKVRRSTKEAPTICEQIFHAVSRWTLIRFPAAGRLRIQQSTNSFTFRFRAQINQDSNNLVLAVN